MPTPNPPSLLIVTETLALPWLDSAASAAGFECQRCRSVREAIAFCRRSPPSAILAEYHFNPTYSSFTSSLESLIAGVQKYAPCTRLVIITEPGRREHLRGLVGRFEPSAILDQPVTLKGVEDCLRKLAADLG